MSDAIERDILKQIKSQLLTVRNWTILLHIVAQFSHKKLVNRTFLHQAGKKGN